jgi:Fe-S-cluster containining protein
MLRKIMLWLILLDNAITQGLKRLFPTAWKIGGSCKQCGKCCEEILLKAHPALLKGNWITKLTVKWIEWVFQFYLIRIDREGKYLVFSCHHRGADGKCQVYNWRPSVCRNYPLLDYFKEPRFLDGCGYYGVKSKSL